MPSNLAGQLDLLAEAVDPQPKSPPLEQLTDRRRAETDRGELPPVLAKHPILAGLVRDELVRSGGPRPGYLRGLAMVESRRGDAGAAAVLVKIARELTVTSG